MLFLPNSYNDCHVFAMDGKDEMNFNASLLIIFLKDRNVLPVEEIPASLCSFRSGDIFTACHVQILGQKVEQNTFKGNWWWSHLVLFSIKKLPNCFVSTAESRKMLFSMIYYKRATTPGRIFLKKIYVYKWVSLFDRHCFVFKMECSPWVLQDNLKLLLFLPQPWACWNCSFHLASWQLTCKTSQSQNQLSKPLPTFSPTKTTWYNKCLRSNPQHQK